MPELAYVSYLIITNFSTQKIAPTSQRLQRAGVVLFDVGLVHLVLTSAGIGRTLF